MRKALSIILVLVLTMAILAVGCSSSGGNSNTDAAADEGSKDEPIIIKISHVVPETHASHIALEEVFKKQVEENSGGRIQVQIFPNAQLGGDRQSIEAVSIGHLQMTMPGGAVLSGFEEKFSVLDLPFLFKSREAAHKALDGEFGESLNELLLDQEIINLGYAEGGFRNITNSKRPITKPEDLKGIKIRTMENPIHVATFKALGANPTPMSFGELYTALQQGTVDAQENPISLIYTSKFYEVQDYCTLSGHIYGTALLLINKGFYESLPEDLQKVVKDAAEATRDYQRQLTYEQDQEFLGKLKQEGMEIYELSSEEKDAFIKAVQPVYDEFAEKHGSELIDLALKAQK